MVISSSFSLDRFGTQFQAAEHPALFLGCHVSAGRRELLVFLSP